MQHLQDTWGFRLSSAIAASASHRKQPKSPRPQQPPSAGRAAVAAGQEDNAGATFHQSAGPHTVGEARIPPGGRRQHRAPTRHGGLQQHLLVGELHCQLLVNLSLQLPRYLGIGELGVRILLWRRRRAGGRRLRRGCCPLGGHYPRGGCCHPRHRPGGCRCRLAPSSHPWRRCLLVHFGLQLPRYLVIGELGVRVLSWRRCRPGGRRGRVARCFRPWHRCLRVQVSVQQASNFGVRKLGFQEGLLRGRRGRLGGPLRAVVRAA
mmetsp:Transcript_119449/g.273668  ORF Transcript_119449/g.273668 Transcript_119449/m.273668 type:complete len:263 (+) Transcript_119449:636-1424(+)